jgi:hypothetical protein
MRQFLQSKEGGNAENEERTWLFSLFYAQLAQTPKLLLELLTHLGKIFRDLGPCFEDCGVDDFFEELVILTQGYLEVYGYRATMEDGQFNSQRDAPPRTDFPGRE